MRKKTLNPPESLVDAVQLVARLGGWLARKTDPPPGHEILWQGYTALQWMGLGFELARQT
jgi:hypothetical protein